MIRILRANEVISAGDKMYSDGELRNIPECGIGEIVGEGSLPIFREEVDSKKQEDTNCDPSDIISYISGESLEIFIGRLIEKNRVLAVRISRLTRIEKKLYEVEKELLKKDREQDVLLEEISKRKAIDDYFKNEMKDLMEIKEMFELGIPFSNPTHASDGKGTDAKKAK
jgi:hypothetical protein